MNIFIHRRDLRIKDNTTLIEQTKNEGKITSIFIFDPLQIDPKKNKYFSNNLVQFMIESLQELKKDYQKMKGDLYFFNDEIIKVLTYLQSKIKIKSLGFNFDYSPYSKKRDQKIIQFCQSNQIKLYCKEDMLLHPIEEIKLSKVYKVFTPFKKKLMLNYDVLKPNPFKKFSFQKFPSSVKTFTNINKFYISNKNIFVNGGRKNAKKKLKKISLLSNYNNERNNLTYQPSGLSAYINFNLLSIREIYYFVLSKFNLDHGLINELYWRDFYYNILYHFPNVVGNSFNKKYDNLVWENNKAKFNAWKNGKTGFPIVDACMRQLNKIGYMHNRGRMIVSSFLTKDLRIDWRWGEKYFATKLIDYNVSANNGGWQWASGSGTDAQPYFRIFNPWTQAEKFDHDCIYIKTWIPELKSVPNKHILQWYKYHSEYPKIKYFNPICDHSVERKKTLEMFKKYL